ncbi:uncharacterized protein K460DRAFT_360050 [Cucurbitaria berberidis CBS 394.84]|uniref:Uncharacterized protein n=1 Tax=Cucurbitaria berberidis CBS 394.84 TaxID=1168544 RepID=A0A9P4G7A9_9PLEO|nr:uncharacterized protein K460DRAFT_360050 [Cucurbitaria berberidis CBS 394.84]KAF1840362.1 hypothetical protein K460DRAFT_360050 [Cucurbitaria berberidis CBS 394.84]
MVDVYPKYAADTPVPDIGVVPQASIGRLLAVLSMNDVIFSTPPQQHDSSPLDRSPKPQISYLVELSHQPPRSAFTTHPRVHEPGRGLGSTKTCSTKERLVAFSNTPPQQRNSKMTPIRLVRLPASLTGQPSHSCHPPPSHQSGRRCAYRPRREMMMLATK